MDGDVLKLAFAALGSGGLVAALIKVIGPALKLNQVGNDSSARAIAQWEKLFAEQKEETAAALKAVVLANDNAVKADARAIAAEKRMRAAEKKTDQLEVDLTRALSRIRQLEIKATP